MTTYSLNGFVYRNFRAERGISSETTASAELVLSAEAEPLWIVLPGAEDLGSLLPDPVTGSFYAGLISSDDIVVGGTAVDIRSAIGSTRAVTWPDDTTSTVLFLSAGGPVGAGSFESYIFAFVLDGEPWHQDLFETAPWDFFEVAMNAPLSTSGPLAIGEMLDISEVSTAMFLETDLPFTPPPGTLGDDLLLGTPGPDEMTGLLGSDTIQGDDGDDLLVGDYLDTVVTLDRFQNRLLGEAGNDTLVGGNGNDTLNGGDGDDVIFGGPRDFSDLRDVIYAGAGNDYVDAGAGNDLVFGQDGNDTIAGGAGVDELQGQDGDDVITGSNFSDLVFGGAGNDFVNGGFGHDRINGGTGADKFFHVGVEGHGSDWVQDYSADEGDVLLFGNVSATRDQFQVNFAHTENAAGERSGDDAVQEAFVIYRPTGQIMWALVDGEAQNSINLQIGVDTFDLLSG